MRSQPTLTLPWMHIDPQLPIALSDPGLVNPAGVSVAYRDWAHLFLWPGDLLYEPGQAIATGAPATIAAPNWDYRRVNAHRNARQKGTAPETAPTVSLRELRSQLGYEPMPTRQHSTPDRPDSISRPNLVAAFGQAQQVTSANPALERLSLQSLEQAAPPPTDPSAHRPLLAGAQWALDWLAIDVAGEPLISAPLLDGLGPGNCGKILAVFLVRNFGRDEVLRSHLELTTREQLPVDELVARKQSRLAAEMQLWAEAGRGVVLSPAGEPDELLSAVNAAAGLVGLLRCIELGKWLSDWQKTLKAALSGFSMGLFD